MDRAAPDLPAEAGRAAKRAGTSGPASGEWWDAKVQTPTLPETREEWGTRKGEERKTVEPRHTRQTCGLPR